MLRLGSRCKIGSTTWVCQRWFCRLWACSHPGSAHKCTPLEHLSPGFASWHPCGKLNAQHRRSPALVCKALPIRPRGMFGPRPFLFFPPLPFPLPFEGPGLVLTDVLDLARLGVGAVGFAAAGFSGFGDLSGIGNRWKHTDGWASTLLSSSSSGSVPASFLFNVLTLSAM